MLTFYFIFDVLIRVKPQLAREKTTFIFCMPMDKSKIGKDRVKDHEHPINLPHFKSLIGAMAIYTNNIQFDNLKLYSLK